MTRDNIQDKAANNSSFKWRAMLGLLLIAVSTVMGWWWIWGVIFIIWMVPDLKSGTTHFVEPVDRRQNPFVYWSIMTVMLGMSVYATVYYLKPDWFGGDGGYNYQYTSAEDQETSSSYIVLNDGEYVTEKPVNGEQGSINVAGSEALDSIPKDTLRYKTLTNSGKQHFVGISTELAGDENDEAWMDQLWAYFMENDISEYIYNIKDYTVYCVFSDYDESTMKYHKATLGYEVTEIKDVYEGMAGISLPSADYAVFEENSSDSENFISDTWIKLHKSELYLSGVYAIEAYTFDDDYNIIKTELRVAF